MSRRLALLACAALLAGCGGGDGEAESPSWNHDPDDAELGPSSWGEIDPSYELCAAGRSQSPIDIADAVATELPTLEFDYSPAPLVVENTGHVIEVPMPESSDNTLRIDDEEYRLEQYHFHAPSEHARSGAAYDVEAHLVHRNEAGELAVVGVFLDAEQSPSELVESVVVNAPEEADEEVELEEEADPLELLPLGGASAATSYFTYPGSLTTPGCSEGVRWLVLEETLGVSPSVTERLHELIAGFPGYDGYENNNRPTQPLNDRVVRHDDD